MPNVLGRWLGEVPFLPIMVTTKIGRLLSGSQDIVQGVIIILVLAVAGSGGRR